VADTSDAVIVIDPHLERDVLEVAELMYARRDCHLVGDRLGCAIEVRVG